MRPTPTPHAEHLRIGLIHRTISRHGGTERYAWDLARALTTKGVEIHLIGSTLEDVLPKWKLHPLSQNFSGFARLISFAWQAERYVHQLLKNGTLTHAIGLDRMRSPGIVRLGGGCHQAHLEAVEGWQGRRRPLRHVFNLRHPYYLWLERQWLEGPETQAVIAVSERVKAELLRHHRVPDERVVVLHNGVQLERFEPERHRASGLALRKQLGLDPQALGLLLVGSGARRKGTETALEAVAGLLQQVRAQQSQTPLPFFLAVGKDAPAVVERWCQQAPAWMRAQVRALPPQDVIEACYAACQLLVLPTRYEPFGNVCLEAMSMGLPALTSACNGVTELYPASLESLILPDPLDAGALTARLLEVTHAQRLPPLAAEARRVALLNGVEVHADRLLSMIIRLPSMRGGQNPPQRI